MAITLSGELLTAMDAQTRNPRVSITSDQYEPAIPMDGQYINTLISGEHDLDMFLHSTGRWVGAYLAEGNWWTIIGSSFTQLDGMYINLIYSDIERKEFTTIEHAFDVMGDEEWGIRQVWNMLGLAARELPDGNIGVVFTKRYFQATYAEKLRLSSIVFKGFNDELFDQIDPGTIVTGEVEIENWNNFSENDYTLGRPNLFNSSGSTFLCTYPVKDWNVGSSGEYYLYQRSTSDWVTWTSEQLVTAPFASKDPSHRVDNPFIIAGAAGQTDCLFFDYIDEYSTDRLSYVSNTYKFESDGDYINWGSGEKITSHTAFGFGAERPTAILTSGEYMKLAYHDIRRVLHMDEDQPGWCLSSTGDATTYCSSDNWGSCEIHLSVASRLLYVVNRCRVTGMLCSITVVDPDNWEVLDCYSDTTDTAIPSVFSNHGSYPRTCLNDPGDWVGFGCTGALGDGSAMIFNYETEDLTEISVDIDLGSPCTSASWELRATYLSEPYMFFLSTSEGGPWESKWRIYYIDLTDPLYETGDVRHFAGTISWAYEYSVGEDHLSVGYQEEVNVSTFRSFRYHKDVGAFTIYSYGFLSPIYFGGAAFGYGTLRVIASGATSGTYGKFYGSDVTHHGPRHPTWYNGAWYCGGAGASGAYRIDGQTGEITTVTPDCVTLSDYGLDWAQSTPDGKVLFTSDNGIYLYNTVDDLNPLTTAWVRYNNDTVPGYTPDGDDNLWFPVIAYDPLYHIIHWSRGWSAGAEHNGISSMSVHGAYRQMEYHTGSFGADWSFDSKSHLTKYFFDYEGIIQIDPVDDYIWCFWCRGDIIAGEIQESIKWDKGVNYVDLADWLTDSVEITWAVGEPNELTFSLAEGHLWDPHNLSSLYHIHTQRGRKIFVKFGEEIDGTTYWQDQGDFIVEDLQLTYKRPNHPIAKITARDRRSMWGEGEVQLTQDFSGEYPETVLATLLEDHCKLVSGESYALPLSGEMSFSHPIYMRWIDTNILDIINELLDHFRYVPYYDVDGMFKIKEIDFHKETDHLYPDHTKLIDYTPSNAYSVYTNRVVVKAEGRYDLPVTYGEEMYDSDWGTIGWYGISDKNVHWYSQDHQLKCVSPRIKVTKAPETNSFFGGSGGSIRMLLGASKYCIVKITSSNRIPELIAAIVMVGFGVVCGATCDAATRIPIIGGSLGFCGLCIIELSIATTYLGEILGTMGHYSYEVYARPTGTVKQTFQQEANDFESQLILDGMVITEEIDDPLSYTSAHCKFVAERTMELIRFQRYGVNITKVADLRDQLLDVIEILHPCSGQPFKYMIHSLTRRFQKSGIEGGEDGFFLDDLEGWNLSILRTDISIDP